MQLCNVQVCRCISVQLYRCTTVWLYRCTDVCRVIVTMVQEETNKQQRQEERIMLQSQVASGVHISLNNSQGVYVSCSPNGLQALASYEVVMLHSTTLDAIQGLPIIQTQTFGR